MIIPRAMRSDASHFAASVGRSGQTPVVLGRRAITRTWSTMPVRCAITCIFHSLKLSRERIDRPRWRPDATESESDIVMETMGATGAAGAAGRGFGLDAREERAPARNLVSRLVWDERRNRELFLPLVARYIYATGT